MHIRRLINNSLLISVLFGLDKIVGLGRQVLVGKAYGVASAADAYNAANNLPDMVYALISGGALAMAFIPVLTETLDREGRPAAWDLFSRVANWVFTITAGSALVLALLAGPFVRYVVAPGFTPEQQQLTTTLMRLDLLALLVFSISGLVAGGLQANQHFLLPALAPLLYNVGQIIGVVWLSPQLGIYGLALGAILGAVLHLAIQLPGLWRYGFKWTPALNWKHPGVVRVARLMGPRILTVAAIQVIFITTDRFASHLTEGAVTAILFGWLILQLPETVIGTAVGTALLPTLSELAARNQLAELKSLLRRALAVMLAIMLPLTAACLVLVGPAVKLVFEGRNFTPEDTVLVVAAAQMFLLGLTGHSLVEILVRAFYARKKVWVPLLAAVFTATTFILFSLALVPQLGHAGIALANSLAFTAEAGLLALILWRRGLL